MRANKFFTTILSLSLVFFMACNGIANPVSDFTGDNSKKNENVNANSKTLSAPAADIETDFGYLRFDVNNYVYEGETVEMPLNSYDYLRFDVSKFTFSNDSERMELPVANEFDYLRFDVESFTANNSQVDFELPASEFDYLRFDVNRFIAGETAAINELPVKE